MIDYNLFEDILGFDSTSGRERPLAEFLSRRLKAPKVETFEVGDGTLNLLFSWGTPRVVYCSHMDTVPPYLAPSVGEGKVTGRGSCDAKGQIIAMYTACCELAAAGKEGFGLLLLLIDVFVLNRRNRRLNAINLFKNSKLTLNR